MSSRRWRRARPPRRRALEVALQLAEPGDRAPDAHAIGLALLDVLRALAERGPVLVALDDVQWLDPASAGVLQIAFRRLRDEHVGLLATCRWGPTRTPFELEQLVLPTTAQRISLGPLSLGAVHSLLEERLGARFHPPGARPGTGGDCRQPLLCARAGSRARPHEHPPDAGQPLRVPESLRELLGGRLARLPGETLDVLLEAAALARPTVELVAAVQGDRDRVLEALEAAVREGAVELDDSRIRFAHPCSPPFATSGRRSGSAEQFTAPLPAWSAMSRSAPATWRSPPMALTPSPLPTWTLPLTTRRDEGPSRQLPSSTSSRPD